MIPLVRPTLPSFDELKEAVQELLETGMITHGKYVRAFEQEVARYLGVQEAIAVASGTLGLMLVMSDLPKGSEVIVPGFTFSGTYQGLQWNDLEAVIVDCDESCNIDPDAVEKAITSRTSAVVGVHISGVPCQIERLEALAKKHGLRLIFDSAHALGSKYHGKNIGGFGDAEVFSMSPSKVLAVGEGGVIATNSREFADRLRLAANHGKKGDEMDCVNKALNGRMEEFNGLLGLVGLKRLDENVQGRMRVARYYRDRLGKLPGISFPFVHDDVVWTVKDFSLFVDPRVFGKTRDDLSAALKDRGIHTKYYYYPPLHRISILKDEYKDVHLPRTEKMTREVISLPAYSHMPQEQVETVCLAIEEIHRAK